MLLIFSILMPANLLIDQIHIPTILQLRSRSMLINHTVLSEQMAMSCGLGPSMLLLGLLRDERDG